MFNRIVGEVADVNGARLRTVHISEHVL